MKDFLILIRIFNKINNEIGKATFDKTINERLNTLYTNLLSQSIPKHESSSSLSSSSSTQGVTG